MRVHGACFNTGEKMKAKQTWLSRCCVRLVGLCRKPKQTWVEVAFALCYKRQPRFPASQENELEL